MFLTKPSKKFEQSWLCALKEFAKEDRKVFWEVPKTPTNLDEYIKRTEDNKAGRNLHPQIVPTTTYWLIDDNEYIGHVIIRHKLNERLRRQGGHIGYAIRPSKRRIGYGSKILQLALQKAKEMGLHRILITCDDTNIASARVIERNGGKLENKVNIKGKLVRRYWIKLKYN